MPLLVKIAPDLTEREKKEIAGVVMATQVSKRLSSPAQMLTSGGWRRTFARENLTRRGKILSPNAACFLAL